MRYFIAVILIILFCHPKKMDCRAAHAKLQRLFEAPVYRKCLVKYKRLFLLIFQRFGRQLYGSLSALKPPILMLGEL